MYYLQLNYIPFGMLCDNWKTESIVLEIQKLIENLSKIGSILVILKEANWELDRWSCGEDAYIDAFPPIRIELKEDLEKLLFDMKIDIAEVGEIFENEDDEIEEDNVFEEIKDFKVLIHGDELPE